MVVWCQSLFGSVKKSVWVEPPFPLVISNWLGQVQLGCVKNRNAENTGQRYTAGKKKEMQARLHKPWLYMWLLGILSCIHSISNLLYGEPTTQLSSCDISCYWKMRVKKILTIWSNTVIFTFTLLKGKL